MQSRGISLDLSAFLLKHFIWLPAQCSISRLVSPPPVSTASHHAACEPDQRQTLRDEWAT